MPTKKRAVRSAGSLDALFHQKLGESLLDDASLLKRLQFKLRDAKAAPSWLPFPAGGFFIPYFDLAGKKTQFERYRYLEDYRQEGSFEAITTVKPLRYVQPKGSVNELYLPPVVDWKSIAQNTSQPLIITEGELKAACASAWTETPAIGLGGVWCFRAAREYLPILPMFKNFKWDDRLVYIIYDSDASTNPKVKVAENALAYELNNLGALPHIVRLPPLADGKKCGLDDYIVHNGKDLSDVLESAAPWAALKELHKLNEEVMYVRDPGYIIRLDNRQRIAPRAFVDHAYSTRFYHELQETEKGTKQVEKSAPKEWLKWPYRAEVERATYAPGQPMIVQDQLNIWPGWGVEPKRGDITPWKKLLDHLFGGDKAARQWFERWCACPIQQPGVKMYTSAVLWGLKHGTGKSFVGYSLFKIYGSNAIEIKDENLQGGFNDWAENKQFVMGDEITGGDKRSSSDRLKSIITQQQLRINAKYIPAYVVPDCINYYFTSNHPDSFFLEDKDRRMFIWEVVNDPLPDEFYAEYEAWIGKPNETGPGASALMHHLMTLDLGDFNPKARAPMTDSKEDMMRLGRSDLGAWVAALRETPDTVLKMGGMVVPFKLMRSEDLLRIYDPEGRGKVSANGFARELRRQGVQQVYRGNGVFTKTDGQVRLWAVRPLPDKIYNNGVALGKLYDEERELKTVKEKYK